MSETVKTEKIKINRTTKSHGSGYSFTSEFKYRDARKDGQFAEGSLTENKEYIETPSGEKIETIEEAYNHIKKLLE